MTTLILAHDIGTSGDKATLLRDDGSLVASAFASLTGAFLNGLRCASVPCGPAP